MTARLASGIWVAAYLTRLRLAGIPVYVTAKGDATAGAVIVKLPVATARSPRPTTDVTARSNFVNFGAARLNASDAALPLTVGTCGGSRTGSGVKSALQASQLPERPAA